MPTLLELSQAYPGVDQRELQTRWEQKHPNEPLSDVAQSHVAEQGAQDRLSLMGKIKAYGEPVMDAARTAAIPASLLSGPVGMAAGGYLAYRGIKDAVQDPSPTNIGLAALQSLPVAGPALKTAGHGLGYVGNAIPRSVRGLVGAGGIVSGHPSLLALEAATNPKLLPKLLTKSGEGIENFVNTAKGAAMKFFGPAEEAAATTAGPATSLPPKTRIAYGTDVSAAPTEPAKTWRSAASELNGPSQPRVAYGTDISAAPTEPAKLWRKPIIDPENAGWRPPRFSSVAEGPTVPNNPVAQSLEQERRAIEQAHLAATPRTPPSIRMLDEAAPAAQASTASAGEMSPILEGLKRAIGENVPMSRARSAAAPVAAAPRPSSSFMHAADTSGSQFGFDSLPPISEGELTRLQALFSRLGHR